MPDYQKGLIYKIVALNCEDPDQVYYGSTTKSLSKRLGGHRVEYKRWKNGNFHFVTSFYLFENYGIENCKILLVEVYPCNSKNELDAKEAEYITHNNCLNRYVPNRTQKEWREEHKEELKIYMKQYTLANLDNKKKYNKQYYINNLSDIKKSSKLYAIKNATKIKEDFKIYYEKNKENVLTKNKLYRDNHKTKMIENKKKYYQNNKISIINDSKQRFKIKWEEGKNNPYTCICGSVLNSCSKLRHFKTKIHQTFLSNNPEQTEL